MRAWWNRFGPMFAADIRKNRSASMHAQIQQRWHLDEVFVTKKRDRNAALRFLQKAMKRYGRPKIIVTDRLLSYGAAMKVIGVGDRQLCGQWLKNGAGNSHQPFRRREREMAKIRSAKSLQKFISIHASVHNHFNAALGFRLS